jgi:hypothetical protein
MDKINQAARVLTACIESDHKKPDSQYDFIAAQFNFSTHFRKHGQRYSTANYTSICMHYKTEEKLQNFPIITALFLKDRSIL